MPIYEYICKSCSHGFEHLMRGADAPHCPSCDSEQLQRKLSAFAVSRGGSTPMASAPVGGCGSCGDPRGPGACSMDN